jgi:hypothetical protein
MKLNNAGLFTLSKPIEFKDNNTAIAFASERITRKNKEGKYEVVRWDNYIMRFVGDAADKAGILSYDPDEKRGDAFFIVSGSIECPYNKEETKQYINVTVFDFLTYDEWQNSKS